VKSFGFENKFIVGYVGTHGMAHALENVLDAAELLISDDDIRFLFIGSGAAREKLIASAKRRNLKNVMFHPSQPKDLIPDYLSLLDVDLIHLKNDPIFRTVIPSKIFEAMGMGIPILLSGPESSEAGRIVETDKAGLCVRSGVPDILAEAIVTLKNDRLLRNRLAEASHRAVSKYTRERQAREVIGVVENVMNALPAGR
jgi:glycosyltransferase involved in cell wall biosynthesis